MQLASRTFRFVGTQSTMRSLIQEEHSARYNTDNSDNNNNNTNDCIRSRKKK